MVVFTLLQNRVHVFANFMFNLDRDIAVKVLNCIQQHVQGARRDSGDHYALRSICFD